MNKSDRTSGPRSSRRYRNDQLDPRDRRRVATPPRVPKLAAAVQPSVPTQELAQSTRGARERADPGSPAQARRRRRRPDRHRDERDRHERHQVDPVLRHQGAAAADQHLGHDARGRAHQGHRPRRRRAQPHGPEAARARLRGHRPARQAELAAASVRPQEPGAQIHRRVRGRARSDRQDHDRARAAQDPAAHRHHQARQAVRRQPRLLPHARGVHRRRVAPSSRSWTRRSFPAMEKKAEAVRGRHPGAESARPAFGARRSGAPRARSAAHAPGHHAEPAEHPPRAGERQVAGQQDQLDDREHGAAVAPAARPGDHHLPRRPGGGIGRGGIGPDQRAAAPERQEPARGQCRGARADGARGVRPRHGARGQRGADRDHRGQPADRGRGQEDAGRGGEAADRMRERGCARPCRRRRARRQPRRRAAPLRRAERDRGYEGRVGALAPRGRTGGGTTPWH